MSRQFFNYIRKLKTSSFKTAQECFDLSTSNYATQLCRQMLSDWIAGDKRPIYKLKKLLEISDYDGYISDTACILLKEFGKLMDNDSAIDKERQKLRHSIPRFLEYKYNNTLQKITEITSMLPDEYGNTIVDNSYQNFKNMLEIDSKELYMIAAKEFYEIAQNRLLLDNIKQYTAEELFDKIITHLYTYGVISSVGYCSFTFMIMAQSTDILNYTVGSNTLNIDIEKCRDGIGKFFPELLTNIRDIKDISEFIFDTKSIRDIGNESIIDKIPRYIAETKSNDPIEELIIETEDPNIIYIEPKACKDVLVINTKHNILDYTESIIDELCDKIMNSENAKLITRRIIMYHRNANYIKDRISHRVDARLQTVLKTVLPKQRLSKINLCKERALQYQYENIKNTNHAISQLLFDNLVEMVRAKKEFYDIANKYYLNKNIINSTTPEESFHAIYYDGAAVYILYFLDEIANKLTNRWRA